MTHTLVGVGKSIKSAVCKTITKSKRKLDKSNFTQSVIGASTPLSRQLVNSNLLRLCSAANK